MAQYVQETEFSTWRCDKCDSELELRKVVVSYLEGSFPVDLPVCKKCGQVFIPESLAMHKMLEIEQQMEDK
ncbi:MAG: DVU_1557 family redox protein [Flexilinea sp.]|jgi:NAD-dependent SIR2 family protein deacetylase